MYINTNPLVKESILFIVLILLFNFCSSDNEPQPVVDPYIDIQNISTQTIDLNDLENESLSFDIDLIGFDKSKVKTVTLHSIFKDADDYPEEWLDWDQDSTYEARELRKILAFPSTIEIPVEEMFYVVPEFTSKDLLNGDQFEFFFSIQFDDSELPNPELTPILCQDSSQLSVDQCSFFLNFICEYDPTDILGTWEVVIDEEGYYVPDEGGKMEVEIISGPNENQATILNIFNHVNPDTGDKDYDVILDINPINNSIEVISQDAWNAETYGSNWGTIRVWGGGFISTCTGEIEMQLKHTGAAFDGWFSLLNLRKK